MRDADGKFRPVEACLTPSIRTSPLTGALLMVEQLKSQNEEQGDACA
jgi:hypothetical protein